MKLNESAIKVIEQALENGQECEVRRITQNTTQVMVLPEGYFTRDLGYPILLGKEMTELRISVRPDVNWMDLAIFTEPPYTWLLGMKMVRQPGGSFNIHTFPD